MKWFVGVKSQKIYAIVGDKRVLLFTNYGHELPVFVPTQRQIIDMIGHVPCCVRQFNQGRVQAFIDEELHCRPTRLWSSRVTRTGLLLAQGRLAGRPRRGNACT